MCRHDAIFGDDAVLLAAGDDLAGQQDQWLVCAIDQHQPVHLGALVPHILMWPSHQSGSVAGFGDYDFARPRAFVQRNEVTGVMNTIRDDRKNGEVTVRNRAQQAVIINWGWGGLTADSESGRQNRAQRGN